MSYDTVTLASLSFDKGSYGIPASAVDYSADLPTYLRITDINDDGTINSSGLKSVDHPDAARYFLSPNDIVFARTGASTGRNYFYDGKEGNFVYAGFLIKFSINPEKVNPRFIKYYCQSQDYYDWVSSFNTGSTRGNINAVTLASMPIPKIDRKLQELIVQTLTPLDEMIKHNNRIIANLEAQAQVIFKSWFVDFEPFQEGEFEESELGLIPKGWRVGVLSDIAQITMGQSPSGDSFNENEIGTVFYQGRAEFGFRFPTRRLFTTEPTRVAQSGDVLLSVRAPVGDINVATEECCIGRGLSAIHSLNGCQSYLLYLVKQMHNVLDRYNGEGTVFGSINRKDLNQLAVIIPPIESMQRFQEMVGRFDAEILTLNKENTLLVTARDTLLPKLMSGEIEVSVEG